jgi:hypothetical protein
LRRCSRASGPGGGIFGEIDSLIALAFLLEFPTPECARLGQKQMAAFLSDQGYCGRRSPDELLQRLRAAPVIKLGPAEMVAKGTLVCSYATLLDNTVKQIRQITSAIERAVMAHSDATVFTSFPRIGKVNAAQILAELGDVRDPSRPTPSSPPRPASAPSPAPRARAAASSSDGPATTACAPPSPAGPTTPARLAGLALSSLRGHAAATTACHRILRAPG